MKTLLILRHAKSSWDNALLTDHERPLNLRGKEDAPRVGRLMREEDLVPDLILSSSAKRALSTAERAAEACDYEGEIVVRRALYHGAPEDYLEALNELGGAHGTILVVGHNPGMEELLALLTDEDEVMPTAALAQVALPVSSWHALSEDTQGRLENLWRPRELK